MTDNFRRRTKRLERAWVRAASARDIARCRAINSARRRLIQGDAR